MNNHIVFLQHLNQGQRLCTCKIDLNPTHPHPVVHTTGRSRMVGLVLFVLYLAIWLLTAGVFFFSFISYKIAYAPIEDSDQPAHPRNLIRVFPVHSKPHWILGYTYIVCGDSYQTARMHMLSDLRLRWSYMQSCRKCLSGSCTCNIPQVDFCPFHNEHAGRIQRYFGVDWLSWCIW